MILIQPPVTQDWDNLQGKPIILTDNQIHWNEIQGIPERITFLASNIPTINQSWVLSNSNSGNLEWLFISIIPETANPSSIVQRDSFRRITAANFRATAIPTSLAGLGTGHLYRDSEGFVKVVF